MQTTAERQGRAESVSVYKDLECHKGEAQFCLLVAEDEFGPIAAVILLVFGDTVVYKRGAWSGRSGNLHPNEALHWAAIRWAKALGLRFYDFDGIDRRSAEALQAGPPIPEHAMNSPVRFKVGFGGDVILNPPTLAYFPNAVLRFGSKRVLHLLSRSPALRRVVARVRRR
jgi:lipid II:glycine glycyltransferase (peptidoglycan interpeptide bridge formation enzyme)